MLIIISDEQNLLFERFNSKYNRLYEQLTNLCLFFIATLLAYYGIWYSFRIENFGSIPIHNSLLFREVTIIYSVVLLVLALVISYLFSHLITAGMKIRDLFRKIGIDYN